MKLTDTQLLIGAGALVILYPMISQDMKQKKLADGVESLFTKAFNLFSKPTPSTTQTPEQENAREVESLARRYPPPVTANSSLSEEDAHIYNQEPPQISQSALDQYQSVTTPDGYVYNNAPQVDISEDEMYAFL